MRKPSIWMALPIGFLLTWSIEAKELQWFKPGLPAVPPARSNASMVYDAATGSTVLFGGNVNNGFTAFGDTWIFTRSAGWLQLFPATSPSPRSGSGFAYDSLTKTVVLFGGLSGDGSALDDTWT